MPRLQFPLADPAAAPYGQLPSLRHRGSFQLSAFQLHSVAERTYRPLRAGGNQLTENVSVYVKGLFNQRKSTNQAAPEPIFVGPEAGNGGGSLLDITEVDVDNPFNPLGFTSI